MKERREVTDVETGRMKDDNVVRGLFEEIFS